MQVIWNSKNNRIVGIAMGPDQLASLHDVFRTADEGFRTHKTSYILQFMWRDLSAPFDAVGPFFTSESGLDTMFLMSCVFEAMFAFETYGFSVGALVCDGASCNLSLLKRLCGTAGKFGSTSSSIAGRVPCSFVNPYSGHPTYLIVCPSHQVIHMLL